jgi:hypothetical protein
MNLFWSIVYDLSSAPGFVSASSPALRKQLNQPDGGALHVAVIQKRQEAAAGVEAIREADP